jgi:hypothetical protein
MKSNQNDKVLAYFNALSEEQCAEILKNLRNNKEEEEFMGNENKPPGFKTVKVEVEPEEIKKAELYDNIMKEQRKKQLFLNTAQALFLPIHLLQVSKSPYPPAMKEIFVRQESLLEKKSVVLMLSHARRLETRSSSCLSQRSQLGI